MFYEGTGEIDNKPSVLWKLPFEDKVKMLPGMVANVMATLFSPEERTKLVLELDLHEM